MPPPPASAEGPSSAPTSAGLFLPATPTPDFLKSKNNGNSKSG
jgi:hypothetical protein